MDETTIQDPAEIREQIKHANFVMQRLDKYIGDSNIKGNFILSLNSILIGAILIKSFEIHEIIYAPTYRCFIYFEQTLLTVLLLLVTMLVLMAVHPFLSDGNSSKGKYHSLIFFNSIREFESQNEYLKSFTSQSERELLHDLVSQIYIISKGLSQKYKYLNWAMILVYCELVIVVLIILTTILGV